MTSSRRLVCVVLSLLLASMWTPSVQAMQDAQIVWENRNYTHIFPQFSSVSSDEKWVLTVDVSSSTSVEILIRNLETGEQLPMIYFGVELPQKIINVVFGKDSSTVDVVTEGFYSYIVTLSTSTGQPVDTIVVPLPNGIMSAAFPFADRARWIISASDGLFIFNRQSKTVDTVYCTFGDHTNTYANYRGATWIGISEDESQFYTSGSTSTTGEVPSRLCAWDTKTLAQIYQRDDNPLFSWKPVRNQQSACVPFMMLATESLPNEVQGYIYNLRTGTEVRALPFVYQYGYSFVSLSIDGLYIGYQARDSNQDPIRFMSTETGIVFGQHLQRNHQNQVIHFLSGSNLDVYIPDSYPNEFGFGVRLRLDRPTDVRLCCEPGSSDLHCSVQPNPSDGGTVVTFVLAASTMVTIRLVATDGSIINEHRLGILEAGEHSIPISANAGLYHCTITAGTSMQAFPVIFQ
ncbi:hypothetical protein BH10BAC6_BH10BAC6_09520 [soil metagenome]